MEQWEDGNLRAGQAKVTVVGGAGYIGSVLTHHLLERGYYVRVLDRCFFGVEPLGRCKLFGDRFELRIVDTRDIEAGDLNGTEAVVDLAGLSNDPSCALDDGLTHSINVDGGTRVLEAAQEAGVRRFVYQSSCSVYGSAGEELIDENSILAPVSDYSRSKVEMEERVLKAQGPDFEAVVTRPGTVFGLSPRMRFDLIINTMTLAAVQDRKVFVHGGGSQWRPLVHVKDAANAIQLVLEAPAAVVNGRIFNVGDEKSNLRVSEIAQTVAGLIEGTEIVTLSESTDPRNYRCNFTRVRNELGFRTKVTPANAVTEIAKALAEGAVDTGVRTRTVDFYRQLLDSAAGSNRGDRTL